jgi:pilus assembly protein CpaB
MDRRKLLLVIAVVVALIGAGLVFLYAKGADARAAQAYDPVRVFVAQQDILVGESFDAALAAQKIVERELPSAARVPSAIETVEVLAGQSANGTIAAGEQILTSNFGGQGVNSALAIPPGQVAVSIQLSDTARVAGFVNAGSNVAVWLTMSDAESGDTTTRLLLDRVEVIAVGSTSTQTTTSADGSTVAEQMPRTMITLAVDQEDAERVQLASASGDLAFGLLTDKSKVKPSKGITTDSLFR